MNFVFLFCVLSNVFLSVEHGTMHVLSHLMRHNHLHHEHVHHAVTVADGDAAVAMNGVQQQAAGEGTKKAWDTHTDTQTNRSPMTS